LPTPHPLSPSPPCGEGERCGLGGTRGGRDAVPLSTRWREVARSAGVRSFWRQTRLGRSEEALPPFPSLAVGLHWTLRPRLPGPALSLQAEKATQKDESASRANLAGRTPDARRTRRKINSLEKNSENEPKRENPSSNPTPASGSARPSSFGKIRCLQKNAKTNPTPEKTKIEAPRSARHRAPPRNHSADQSLNQEKRKRTHHHRNRRIEAKPAAPASRPTLE
jgi:hypothetical protein